MADKAFDIAENIRKEFAKYGTGSYPIIFLAEDGTTYEYRDVKTDEENKALVVQLRETEQ